MEAGKKRIIKMTAAVLAVVILAVGAVLSGMAIAQTVKVGEAEDHKISYEGERLNVIFMIGDGMGFDHVAAAEAKYGELFFNNNADVEGEVTTFSRNTFGPTDSAAAATALATGRKTGNGQVGQYCGKPFESLTETALKQGLAAGVIATEGVDGATPAGFSAHTSSRNDKDGILSDQLESGIDLFFGSNAERYDGLQAQIEQAGYDYVQNFEELEGAQGKIFASFEEILNGSGGRTPSLAQLVTSALNVLSANEEGFFLMVEESHIDKCSHDNDLSGALEHVKAYDNAVKAAVEYAQSIGNTIVIVTADHETGGLQYNNESAAELSDDMYTRGSHSSANVPYFVFGEVDFEFTEVMDNTWLSRLARAVLTA